MVTDHTLWNVMELSVTPPCVTRLRQATPNAPKELLFTQLSPAEDMLPYNADNCFKGITCAFLRMLWKDAGVARKGPIPNNEIALCRGLILHCMPHTDVQMEALLATRNKQKAPCGRNNSDRRGHGRGS